MSVAPDLFGWRDEQPLAGLVQAKGPLVLRPISLRDACAFIAAHHRHNKPPRGAKFCVAVWSEDVLFGVATAGRPVARVFDDGVTIEVNRVCTLDGRQPLDNGHVDGTASMLYGACWRAAKAMGYRRAITYTQADELGRSLKGAGWIKVKELAARGSWAQSSQKLKHLRDEVGNGGVARGLWEIRAA